jgi:hypothetical protein
MDLMDMPAALTEPLDELASFHRRAERHLASFAALALHLERNAVDSRSSATATGLIAFFSTGMSLHHADERDLLVLVEARVALGGTLREGLQSDQRDLALQWRGLRKPLEAVAEGLHRPLSHDAIHYFRVTHAAHVTREEGELFPGAARNLLSSDRAVLRSAIDARRIRNRRFA